MKEGQKTEDKNIKVMIIDDSASAREMVAHALESDHEIEVIALPQSAEMAINLLKRQGKGKLDIDVITLDLHMDGVDALKTLAQILQYSPKTQVIMAAKLTKSNAKEMMRAFEIGASDYLIKPDNTKEAAAMRDFATELLKKVKALGKRAKERKNPLPATPLQSKNSSQLKKSANVKLRNDKIITPAAIAIASSTGGPNALTKLFSMLAGKKIKVPVFITQHMPSEFTPLLAKTISNVSGFECIEGKNGDEVRAGKIYLAPGDFHMLVEESAGKKTIKLSKSPPENFCRPAADPMLRSIAGVYGGKVLVVVLTGMGSDGLAGTTEIVNKGGVAIAQDEATSVVWGMPGAVALAGLCSAMEPLDKMAASLSKFSAGGIE